MERNIDDWITSKMRLRPITRGYYELEHLIRNTLLKFNMIFRGRVFREVRLEEHIKVTEKCNVHIAQSNPMKHKIKYKGNKDE